jgi:hypothetical protein
MGRARDGGVAEALDPFNGSQSLKAPTGKSRAWCVVPSAE